MSNIEDFITNITSPPFIPCGRLEDNVIKDVIIFCDLIGVTQSPMRTMYTFRLPNGDFFELDSFEYQTMIARYKELMEEKA